MKRIPGTVIVVVGVIAAGVVAAVAIAAWPLFGDDEAEAQGTCDSAVYQLSVEPEDGSLEVNFELQSAAPDEVWDVVVQQDASILLEGQRTTDEDGELDVDVPTRSIGDNDFVVTATPHNGEACTARLTYG